jgi:hypothetical protein
MVERRDNDRRSGATALRLPERRTGFDRRRSYPVAGVLQDPTWLVAVLASIIVLGIADWALTWRALDGLYAWESNPFMRSAFDAGPLHALALKVASLAAVSAGIWWLRRYRSILLTAAGAAVLHVVLIGYHLAGAALWG